MQLKDFIKSLNIQYKNVWNMHRFSVYDIHVPISLAISCLACTSSWGSLSVDGYMLAQWAVAVIIEGIDVKCIYTLMCYNYIIMKTCT